MLCGCKGKSIVDWRKAIATYTAGFMTSYLQCGQTAISRGADGRIQYQILTEINKLEVRVLINSFLLPSPQLYAERSRIVFCVVASAWLSVCLCVSVCVPELPYGGLDFNFHTYPMPTGKLVGILT